MMQNITKVLHFIHALSGGGAERQLKLLVDNLNEFDIDSAVLCADDAGNDISNSNVRVYKISPGERYSWRFFSMIHSVIKEYKPDVIHTWLPESMTIPAILVARWNRVPIVFSYRNRQYFHRVLTYHEYLFAVFFVSKIITNNPVEQSILPFRWLYSKKKGELIANAVSVNNKYVKDGSVKKNTVCNILFAGRLTYQKNIDLLLAALSGVDNNSWQLAVCGDGEDKDKVMALVRTLGIDNKVTFKGYCSNLYEVMFDSDLLVFPSRFEGMPNVLVEALQIGLPCLVSNILPHKYLLGDEFKDYMFDPDDVNDLRDKISGLLTDESKLGVMAEKGRVIARAFQPSIMAKKYANVYKCLHEKP